MRSLIIIASVVCLLGFSHLHAQSWITGKVTDAKTGESLPAVLVLVEQNRGVTTDEKGVFRLWTEAKQINLQFRLLGYQSQERGVAVVQGDTTRLDIAMQAAVFEMDQVVVTASRVEQRLAELTVSMSLIKPGDIESRNITDTKDLLSRSPGIEVLDGQASIRGGSGFSYGAGSRVLALLDGLPVIAPDAGNIRWQFLPLDNISQVEVIKGASSVVYGSSALNGVINFRTADATSIPSTKVFLQSGVFDVPARKAWKWWDSPRLSASAGLNHLRKMGNSDLGFGFNLLTDNGYRKYNDEKTGRFHLKWKYRHPKLSGLTYGLAANAGITNKTDFVLWDNAATGALIQDTSTAIAMRGSFITLDPFVEYARRDAIRHALKSRIQQSDNHFPDAAQNNSQARSVYLEYQNFIRIHPLFSLQTGVSGQFSQVNSNFHGDHNSRQAGFFTQVESQLNQRLQVVGGLRLEYNDLDAMNTVFKPLFRAGLNYRIKEHTFFRASFGQGFRYPSIAERHASTTLGAVKIYPNFYIQPETGWSAEAGLRQGLKLGQWAAQLDLAAFYMQNKNMIEYLFGIYADQSGSFGFGFKAANIEAARVYGFEAEWMLKGKTGIVTHVASGGYTFSYPVEFNLYSGKNTGEFLKYRRKHSFKAGWDLAFRRYMAGISVIVRSPMLRIDDVFLNELIREGLLPGFYDYWQTANKTHVLADLQLGYRLTHVVQLSFVVRNLTNVEYMGRPGDVQPQRQFLLRLSGTF